MRPATCPRILHAGAILLTLCVVRAAACPACNIHNYMAGSVLSSSNIFEGAVVRQVNERTAEVVIRKVLRGTNAPGSRARTEMWMASNHVGRTFIFSDPTSWPPRFEVLPIECEDEVMFLIGGATAVRDVDDAIRRVQGISVVTQGVGMEYLAKHYDRGAGALVRQIECLMPQVFSTNPVFFGEHRLGKLVEALFAQNSREARAFGETFIPSLATGTVQTIQWTNIPYRVSSRGVFLRDLLSHAKKHESLRAFLQTRLLAGLARMGEGTQSEVVFALVASGAVPRDRVVELVQGVPVDVVALGLCFAGNESSIWWQHDDAYALWGKAFSLAERKELKDAAANRIKESERFFPRRDASGNLPKESGSTNRPTSGRSGNQPNRLRKTEDLDLDP